MVITEHLVLIAVKIATAFVIVSAPLLIVVNAIHTTVAANPHTHCHPRLDGNVFPLSCTLVVLYPNSIVVVFSFSLNFFLCLFISG